MAANNQCTLLKVKIENHNEVELDGGVTLLGTQDFLQKLSTKTDSFRDGVVVDKELLAKIREIVGLYSQCKANKMTKQEFLTHLEEAGKELDSRKAREKRHYLHGLPTMSTLTNKYYRLIENGQPQHTIRASNVWVDLLPVELLIPYIHEWKAECAKTNAPASYDELVKHVKNKLGLSETFLKYCRRDYKPKTLKESVPQKNAKKRPAPAPAPADNISESSRKRPAVTDGGLTVNDSNNHNNNQNCRSAVSREIHNSQIAQGDHAVVNNHNTTITAGLTATDAAALCNQLIQQHTAPLVSRIEYLESKSIQDNAEIIHLKAVLLANNIIVPPVPAVQAYTSPLLQGRFSLNLSEFSPLTRNASDLLDFEKDNIDKNI